MLMRAVPKGNMDKKGKNSKWLVIFPVMTAVVMIAFITVKKNTEVDKTGVPTTEDAPLTQVNTNSPEQAKLKIVFVPKYDEQSK